MTALDAALLNLVERGCRKLQVLTGRTNVWLAFQLTNVSVVVYCIWAVAYLEHLRTWMRVAGAVTVGVIVYLLFQTVFKESIESAEQNAYRRVSKGLRNPRRLRDAPLRVSFLTLSILLCFPFVLVPLLRTPLALLSYSLVLLTTALLYVWACDPLPPSPAKLKEWLKRLVPAARAADTIGDA